MSGIIYYLTYALGLAIAATYGHEASIYCNDCSAANVNCKISEFGRSCRALPPDYSNSSATDLGAYNPLEHGHSSSNLAGCIPEGMNVRENHYFCCTWSKELGCQQIKFTTHHLFVQCNWCVPEKVPARKEDYHRCPCNKCPGELCDGTCLIALGLSFYGVFKRSLFSA
ncbi:uncharacterized protein LOC117898232 isoform X2 [Drosophila subobscura]|uniref:uncharacterized protein LOC117898232 isoform X2 n=1 Tax=Drosophila subobscura TaxID=7241 RepID=UPI00155A4A26|nr:uncharacterized protein LOC117898232 isoform X2 [Drosophila subobscura]